MPPYFEMTVEVYSHQLDGGHHGIASTPQKIARSISRAVGRSILAGNGKAASKDFENVGPKFELVASANLTLDNCSEG